MFGSPLRPIPALLGPVRPIIKVISSATDRSVYLVVLNDPLRYTAPLLHPLFVRTEPVSEEALWKLTDKDAKSTLRLADASNEVT